MSTALKRKSIRIVGVVTLIYGLLVATHDGEFWPFSIYPMFSTAGQPWTRALVRELPATAVGDSLWQERYGLDLPGRPYPLSRRGVFQNDFANFVSKTRLWSPERISGLRDLFSPSDLQNSNLLIYRMRGEIIDGDTVRVTATPLFLLSRDSTHANVQFVTTTR